MNREKGAAGPEPAVPSEHGLGLASDKPPLEFLDLDGMRDPGGDDVSLGLRLPEGLMGTTGVVRTSGALISGMAHGAGALDVSLLLALLLRLPLLPPLLFLASLLLLLLLLLVLLLLLSLELPSSPSISLICSTKPFGLNMPPVSRPGSPPPHRDFRRLRGFFHPPLASVGFSSVASSSSASTKAR